MDNSRWSASGGVEPPSEWALRVASRVDLFEKTYGCFRLCY